MSQAPAHQPAGEHPAAEPRAAARAAGLRYTSDDRPGIRRERAGDEWRYYTPDGAPLKDERTLERIRKLGIPPAWAHVWICPQPNGHLQATGRDARGRKQYRYHASWRTVRDESKYEHMIAFAQALPAIRAQTERDLRRPGLPRAKVLATVVRLLETTLIRVGNQEYADANKSYGLTTMRDKHVAIDGAQIEFSFRGKSGKRHSIALKDRRLARIVRQCRDIPGYELFQYRDEQGNPQDIGSADVNSYLYEITGQHFTAKDFRTWAGTVLAAQTLRALDTADSPTTAKTNVVRAIEQVAERLGNTPAICRKCYVHPAVVEAYLDGALLETLQQRAVHELAEHARDLSDEEQMVLQFLSAR